MEEREELTIERIVKENLSAIYRFAFRLVGNEADAGDIAQEVMVKVWKNLSKYDSSQNFKPWLFKIARNTSMDWLRRRRQIPFSHFDFFAEEGNDQTFSENISDLELLPDEIFAQTEIREKFNQVLETIPLSERMILVLHLEEELTFDEISKIVDRPLNTVKSVYRRSLVKLRSQLIDFAPKQCH